MLLHRRLLQLATAVRWHIAAAVAVGLGVTATYVGQGLLVAAVLEQVSEHRPWTASIPQVAGVLALVAVRAALLQLRELCVSRTAAATKLRLRRRLYAHLLALGPGHLTRTRTGTVQSALVDGVEAVESYYARYLPQLAVCLLAPAALVAYLTWIDWVVGALVAVLVVFVPLAPRWWDRLLGERGQAHWDAYAALDAAYLDTMQGLTTLKAFNAGERHRAELGERAEVLYRSTMAQMKISLVDTGLTAFGVAAGTSLSVGVGALRLAQGALDLAGLYVVLFLVFECFRPFIELSRFWHAGHTAVSAASGIHALLDAVPQTPEPSAPLPPRRTGRPPVVEFEDVTFAYADRLAPALDRVSLRLEAGRTLAVVGPSGAGKTTLVSLLLRFFDPVGGRVLVDGQDIRELPLATLRETIAVVCQDTYLFHGTVADNLRLARPDATAAQMREAARAAGAHAFVEALPAGYDTPVGERGLTLSGGERQRIAIARALLKDAPVLILDEATSSVDAAAEADIQRALGRLSRGRTTLVVAHRLSTVRDAGRIAVLARGRVTEVGDHRSLLVRRGDYARMVAAQAAP
ncbi:ABC transporter ATP-binding protein/permease [Streptomyces sp. NRRL B-1347]|uniref:ABC transporter ATP-binding protein/permease n=1 Tax=Streptomyces sp. NRRL B-1347 TaxID=1476877 RepID=UPI0004C9312D|nr:ABC transporter ATP-binding protein [Streptomyces sp. NRRL B-1347]